MEDKNSPWVDYSHEVRPVRVVWQRNALIILGSLFFGVSIIGIFLPVLPTTPFLLLSAACYAKASARFYNWLMNHYILGPYLRDWRSKKGIPLRTKATAIGLIVLTFSISAIFVIPSFYPRLAFLSIGVIVIIYILRQPTRR